MRISDVERRRRLVRRHHHGRTADDLLATVVDVTAQHSSDPLTPHLGARARREDYSVAHLHAELVERRRLWRLHAMRRTLFVVAVEDAPVVIAGASREVARKERRRLVRQLEAEMPAGQVADWLERTTDAVLDAVGDEERSTSELGQLVPDLQQEVDLGSGRWARRTPVTSRLLFLLAMESLLVRTRPAGTWRSSQYRWARVGDWFGPTLRAAVERADEEEARVELARRYLARHGPATAADLQWWTGWTKGATRRALRELDTVTVELDTDAEGLVLVGDDDVDGPLASPQVALLPSLDASAMGWRGRDWYLGDHQAEVYDNVGNAGPTVWVDGRIVGGWAQRPDGRVVHTLLEDVPGAARDAIAVEADTLTGWLDGTVVVPRFASPLHRRLVR